MLQLQDVIHRATGSLYSMDNWQNFNMKFPIINSGLYESEVTMQFYKNLPHNGKYFNFIKLVKIAVESVKLRKKSVYSDSKYCRSGDIKGGLDFA